MKLSGYQAGPRWQGTRINAALIVSYLDASAETVLDVGSNEGVITCAMAMAGTKAKGLEVNAKYVTRAKTLAKQLKCDASFEHREVSLNEIEDGAEYDVVSFLSVHHQIAASSGLETANRFALSLAQKARKQFFFQPACIRAKYGSNFPNVDENDIGGFVEYFREIIGAEMEFCSVIGLAQNDMPKNEPLRPMMLFSRNPISMNGSDCAPSTLLKLEAGLLKTSRLASISKLLSKPS